MNAKAISEKQSKDGCSSWLLIPFGFIFFAAGVFFLWLAFLAPLLESYQAESWPSTKCEIVHSKVKVNRDSEGDSYKPIVKFQFAVDGINYTSDRQSFQSISGSSKWAHGIVKQHPLGATQQCFYDPEHPNNAVLVKDFSTSFYLFSLIPLIFVAIGGFIMGAGLIASRKKKPSPSRKDIAGVDKFSHSGNQSKTRLLAPDAESAEEADFADKEWSLPRKLKPESSRLTSLLLAALFMLFWNGIVGVFVYQLFCEFDIFLALFLIPFVLVGLLLIFSVVYLFLCLFNPVIKVGISSGAISPGSDFDVAWEVVGNASRFKKLRIHIYGEQSATYRRGTSTVTDDETFEVVEIIETEDFDQIGFGSATVRIPADTMHTFTAEHNKVSWNLAVHGSIAWMPDVHASYPFRVKPI